MNESRKPTVHTGIPVLVMALSLTLAVPVLAAPATAKPGVTVDKRNAARALIRKPQLAKKAPAAPAAVAEKTEAVKPAPIVATSEPAAPSAPQAPAQVLPATTAVVSSPAAIPAVSPAVAVPAAVVAAAPAAPAAAAATAAAPPVNPYLSGWYRPVPAAALPAMAVGQLKYSARYVNDSMTAIPAKLVDALPSIKTVHPTGGRHLVVANLKCPAEMITGQYFIPANAMREGVNGLFSKLNDSQLLKFDIQLVCS